MQDAIPSVNQDVSEKTSTSFPSNPSKKRKFGKFFLLCIVLIVLAIVGASLFIFSPQNDKAKIGNTSSPLDNPLVMQAVEKLPIPKITIVQITLSPTDTATNDQQQGRPTEIVTPQPSNPPALPQEWSTYTNTSLNFSMNYPSGFQAQEKSLGFGVWDISFANDYKLLVYPKTIGKLIGLDFDTFFALPVSSTQRITTEGGTPQQFTKTSSNVISGLRAFEFRVTSDPPDPNMEAEAVVYIELGNSTLIISTRESNKAVLDYMMSTFKYPSN